LQVDRRFISLCSASRLVHTRPLDPSRSQPAPNDIVAAQPMLVAQATESRRGHAPFWITERGRRKLKSFSFGWRIVLLSGDI